MSSTQRYEGLTDEQLQMLHNVCHQFAQSLQNNEDVTVERHIAAAPKDIQSLLFGELLETELAAKKARGESANRSEYEARFPEYVAEIQLAFAEVFGPGGDSPLPEHIGRYRIQKLLGSGGFANVYLGFDDELQRSVAIKVPLTDPGKHHQDARSYLNEAQSLASLDHPHIVPVFDVGHCENVPLYIVSKYIEGSDLGRFLKQNRMSWRASAELIANIASALHQAHTRGLVHRDVKPGNILLDTQQVAYLADFGIAIKEMDLESGPRHAGTPAYMSPEQARGEGHRVDGRSDIYSLGAVLYQLLTGRRIFAELSQVELLERIVNDDPKPPRQINDAIPRELERICLKALARRVGDRYTTALDMANELRQFLDQCDSSASSPFAKPVTSADSSLTFADSPVWKSSDSDREQLRIIPRGLRAFDEHDSEFFLGLLPGPRDSAGMPDNVGFWKTRIEEADPDKTFQVGLIYGPSGCGKSSLVRAGLLPRLAHDITVVYVEATPNQTESRLLAGLRKQCPTLSGELNLKEALTSLRRGADVSLGRKVLIILDQFEQWLHSHTEANSAELVGALRQCDGGRLQCIVLVRDDFWLAVSRFLRDLEIDLVQGTNMALVDLFDLKHARKVLAAFGRAYGRLPDDRNEMPQDNKHFLNQAIEGLAVGGKVACVRLALFAEMMKGRAWTPATMKEVGGIQGVGITFLEEAFTAPSANPKHRLHQQAARAVLGELLPDTGIDIKGRMRSHAELLAASGYSDRPKDFEELIRLLDSELRLITPTDPEGCDPEIPSESAGQRQDHGQEYYQLTHDYLVHSLRDWLSLKQRETRRGRAEIRLEESSLVWNLKPVNRNLPSVWEWATVRRLTEKSRWTPPQKRMMSKAGRYYLKRFGIGLGIVLAVAIIIQQYVSAAAQRNLVERTQTAVEALANSQGILVPHTIQELENYPDELVVAELQTRFANGPKAQQLAIACALASRGVVDVDFLVAQVANAPASETDNLVTALGKSPEASRAALLNLADLAQAESNWPLRHRLGVVLLYLGDPTVARAMCEMRPDRVERLRFISGWSSWHGDLIKLAQQAPAFDDPLLRAGVCVGIGGVSNDYLTGEMKQAWHSILCDWFQNAPEPALHSASLWLLQRWDLDIPKIGGSQERPAEFGWHVNQAGMTMIRVPAGSFQRRYGKTAHRPESAEFLGASLQEVRLTRDFLISDTEVTVGQYRQMKEDTKYPDSEKPFDGPWGLALRPLQLGDPVYSPTDNHPVQWVNWNDAVQFCNWLSRREGYEPCYERTGHVWQIPTGEFEEWRLIDGANGYRLPTEAEWEYACRAGNATQDPFGDEVNALLLAIYGSGQARQVGLNSGGTAPEIVRSKPPDGWGLFDLHGNVQEWCHDWHQGYHGVQTGDQDSLADPMGPVQNDGGLNRVLRGEIFFRAETPFSVGRQFLGFRVVRVIGQ